MKRKVTLIINSESIKLEVEPARSLLQVIREDLGLTGTKAGCERGDCGSCTVIMNGLPVNSCLVLAVEAEGSEILTIEGLSKYGELHPLQKEFVAQNAIQCGFCTPGMIMTAKALLDHNSRPSEEEVRRAIAGNFCRCTGYDKVVKSILAAVR
ncbi:MAG: (2Fe-2S)-binding protein [Thermodesulfobacteriota bacterium]